MVCTVTKVMSAKLGGDHLDPDLMSQTLTDLGVDHTTTAWAMSFMKDHTARLSFNNFISKPFHPSTGTPQGSPLLPILLAIVTSPLLHKSLDLPHSDLTLYIDNSRIFASGPTFISTCQRVTDTFILILDFLQRMELQIDADKTKLMFFMPPHLSQHHGICPVNVTIPLLHNAPLNITPSLSIRYLGIFFTKKLDWSLHIKTMANRTRSMVKALSLLGNSV
jgi:Reverse transcriptase (RNA-dependent DNA polymerase)